MMDENRKDRLKGQQNSGKTASGCVLCVDKNAQEHRAKLQALYVCIHLRKAQLHGV